MVKVASAVKMTSKEDGSYVIITFEEATERLLQYYEMDVYAYLMNGKEIHTPFFCYQLEGML